MDEEKKKKKDENEDKQEDKQEDNQEVVENKEEEYLHGWKRALADYDNLKKELAQEQIRMRRVLIEQTAHLLLPILNNFDQAVRFKPEGLDSKLDGWLQGILHIRIQLENVLQEMGMEQFGQIGDRFDPNIHEATTDQEKEGTEHGMILEVIQRGWRHNDRVIQPAKVIISK